ncbi:MAG TPA: hypothetical protein PKY82_01570 [Pyrinomonadaceae bacterium]|nr:hypothetical protein [Pyrinomonadaceae bacterium]
MKTKDLNEFAGIKIGDLVRWKSGLLGAGRLQYVRNIWQDEDSITWVDLENRKGQRYSSDVLPLWKVEKV